jgi:hypothetical protein
MELEKQLEAMAVELSVAVEGTDEKEFITLVVNALKKAYQLGKRSAAPSGNLVSQ